MITNNDFNTGPIILPREIQSVLPSSLEVDSRIFSKLLDDNKVVASYKMYWLLAILEEVTSDNTEIEFKRLIARMIVYAWYPTLQFKLNYGVFDNLNRPINYVFNKYNYKNNCDEKDLLEFLTNNDDKKLNAMMKELTNKVPYRLLSPFFSESLRGLKDHEKNKIIMEESQKSTTCLYKIIKEDTNKIIVSNDWNRYMQENYKVIKYWIYYKLVCFLQKRNPNIPAIAFKLEAPKSRNLSKATKLWKEIIDREHIKDIYTGKNFTEDNFKQYGVLSIDHFIPWSFVLHDEMWNLTPTFKNINSKKNDKLLNFNNYIENFCSIQYGAFKYLCSRQKENELEAYMNILSLDNPYEYLRYRDKNDFSQELKKCISPLYQIAQNQGFEVIDQI